MERVDYFRIIHKFIPPDSKAYPLYLIHCQLVTRKAIKIAERVGLPLDRIRFVEEAAMLHDVGIVRTNAPSIHCYGELPYLRHLVEGKAILEAEGLPEHARVAERHACIVKTNIIENQLPLPERDLVPETIEEEIVSYADCFYSKHPDTLWNERTPEQVRTALARFGNDKVTIIDNWIERFHVSED